MILNGLGFVSRLRHAGRFCNWLYGNVSNVCRSYLRAQQTSLSLEAAGGLRADVHALASDAPVPDEVLQQRELRTLMRQQLDTLSPKNRAAMLLSYYSGLHLVRGVKQSAAAYFLIHSAHVTLISSKIIKNGKRGYM